MDRQYYGSDSSFCTELSRRPKSEVWNCIQKELAFWENCSTKDCDLIPQLSDTLVGAEFHGMQSNLECWLLENPSLERFEVVGWFLWSYWVKINVDISLTLVREMTHSARRFSSHTEELHAILFGLLGALCRRQPLSNEVKNEILPVLADAKLRAIELKLEAGVISRIDSVLQSIS